MQKAISTVTSRRCVTGSVIPAVDTDATSRPDSFSVQRRHVIRHSLVVVTGVRVTETVARYITNKHVDHFDVNKDSKPKAKDLNFVLVDQRRKSKTASLLYGADVLVHPESGGQRIGYEPWDWSQYCSFYAVSPKVTKINTSCDYLCEDHGCRHLPQIIATILLAPTYTAWWQRHVRVYSLTKVSSLVLSVLTARRPEVELATTRSTS